MLYSISLRKLRCNLANSAVIRAAPKLTILSLSYKGTIIIIL